MPDNKSFTPLPSSPLPTEKELPELMLVDAEIDSVPPIAPTKVRGRAGTVLLAFSLILIAWNMRPLFSSLSVVLPDVMRSNDLGSVAASMLTTLPVLCLGLLAPLAPPLAGRFGTERTLLGVMVLLAIGTALRGLDNAPVMFFASALAGGAIAVGNVLLPSLVKRDFARHAGIMTGLYTMAICAGAATAAALTVPLQHLLQGSHDYALAIWAVPAVIAALVWLPQARRQQHDKHHAGHLVRGLWRDKLAWQLTLFMGLQAAQAYAVLGWLAPILRERGFNAVDAGLVLSLSTMSQLVACLLIPSLAIRLKHQRWLNVALAATGVAGFLALSMAPPGAIWISSIVLGLSQGGLLSVALTMIVLRSPDGVVTAQLSSMVQSVGYCLATVGPLLIGLLHTWTGNFQLAAPLFALLGLGVAITGFGAGRAAHVHAVVTLR